MFIVVEGVDRVGKSTLCASLQKFFVDKSPIIYKYPNFYNRTGAPLWFSRNKTGGGLSGYKLTLAYHENRVEDVENIKKLLNSGIMVIADRYDISGDAYAKALNRPMYEERVKNDLVPDLYILITMPEDIESREGFAEERIDIKTFWTIDKIMYHTVMNKKSYVIIDGNKSKQEIFKKAVEAIYEKWNASTNFIKDLNFL